MTGAPVMSRCGKDCQYYETPYGSAPFKRESEMAAAGYDLKKIASEATANTLANGGKDILINKNLENEMWLMFDWGRLWFQRQSCHYYVRIPGSSSAVVYDEESRDQG